MWELFVAAGTAFGVVFLAELGDKTQLLTLGFGAKYGIRTTIVGLSIGFAISGAIAAVVGGLLGAALPDRPIAIAGGVLFLAFAAFTFWQVRRGSDADADDDEDDIDLRAVAGRSAIVTIAVSIVVGELGDKTQLATATLAAQSNPVAVWAGATVGVICAGTVGAVAGKQIGGRLDPKLVQYASAGLFALFGALLLIGQL